MNGTAPEKPADGTALKRGWTTGACATAASKAALTALLGGEFPDPVSINLPGGQTPSFALAYEKRGPDWAEVGIIKDAGDDPDVTHGAMIVSRVTRGASGSGISFHAGPGVGTITKPGLPLPVGEPAINPVPRKMMQEMAHEIATEFGIAADFSITISVPDGEALAPKTWNPRLGILGGISILGTTGIVVPYSCSAWIHSIHRGIDVARAIKLGHVVGATGDMSERAAQAHLNLPPEAYIDMGDFVGGVLKYLRKHPVPCVTIAGGFGKLSKLAQGAMDLHSGRSSIDLGFLADQLVALGGSGQLIEDARKANTANEVLTMAREAGLPLADAIARLARDEAMRIIDTSDINIGVLIVDRAGQIVGEAG